MSTTTYKADMVEYIYMKGFFLVVFALIAGIIAAFIDPLLILTVVLGLIAIIFLARNLDFGLIILVFFFPYLGLVIDFGAFESLREVQYLKNINAPFVDLFGLLLFAAWGIVVIFKYLNTKKLKYIFPHWKSYAFFWISGLVSLWKVPVVYFSASLKYFARPFTFFYLVFFAMPISIITRSTIHDPRSTFLNRVLLVFYWTGLLSAFNGLLGLLFGTHPDFPRAQPFEFFGLSPLGPNHNLLAETLIATAPAGLVWRGSTSGREVEPRHAWILWGMFFQWGIALLTFSRTAWIAVAAQAIIYIYFTHRGRVRKFIKDSAPVIILLVVMAAILGSTTFTETVRGSTLARLDIARIAAFYFERAPWTGQGLGTFIPTLWQTKAFLLEYGEPLEAHGIIFKLMFEQGLFGLIAFAIFAGSILLMIWKHIKHNQIAGRPQLGYVAALMIASGSIVYQLFNTTYYTSKLWIPLAIAVAIVRIYVRPNEQSKKLTAMKTEVS